MYFVTSMVLHRTLLCKFFFNACSTIFHFLCSTSFMFPPWFWTQHLSIKSTNTNHQHKFRHWKPTILFQTNQNLVTEPCKVKFCQPPFALDIPHEEGFNVFDIKLLHHLLNFEYITLWMQNVKPPYKLCRCQLYVLHELVSPLVLFQRNTKYTVTSSVSLFALLQLEIWDICKKNWSNL